MTAKEHSKLLGIFFLVQGGLQLLCSIFLILIYGGMGIAMMSAARRPEDQTIGGVFLAMGIVFGIFVLLFAGFNLLTGWKLHKQKSGARILGIVASCISLLGFPLGTALGIYGLWFFFGEQGKNYDGASGNMSNNYPPAPPSWQ